MNIATETCTLIEAALTGDPDLASLAVAESSPETLSARVIPGVPAKSIGGSSYSPEPPFRRETLAELVVRMQRLRWQRAAPLYATSHAAGRSGFAVAAEKTPTGDSELRMRAGLDRPLRRSFLLAA